MDKFTVLDLLDLDLKENDALNLVCIAGRPGLAREITVANVNRPGLALNGFYDNFAYERIQMFGRGETAFLKKLEKEQKTSTLEELFSYSMPCCAFSHGLDPTDDFMEIADRVECPVLKTDLPSSNFVLRLMRILGNIFAPQTTIHGVFVEVFGIGVLITGGSGVGKSEAALELIERGHRLICDDAVEVRCVSGNILMGAGANIVTGHHMEIRGLGIINITHLFGVGAIRDKKQVQLVVNLEQWEAEKFYDRLGSQSTTKELLGVNVPYIEIPIKPGRNVPILIETAAMNERLKKMGYFSAREFDENVLKWLESENARALYFQKKDVF